MEAWRRDDGRFPVGIVITIAVLAAAGFGAYWFLTQQGFLAEPQTSPSPSVEETTQAEADARPEWLQGTEHVMPALAIAADERLPESHVLEPWIWDLVDEDWDLGVVRVGEGDQYTWFSDAQELFLVSPTDDLFMVTDFDTTIDRDVVHWDPELKVAWIKRSDGSDWEQVIEFDLVELENTTNFGGPAISNANRLENGIANIEYVGDQSDGTELWVSFDAQGNTTGVMWRDGDEWIPSLVRDEISGMVLQGFSTDRGVAAWLDPEGGRAVFHGVLVDPTTGDITDERWIVHDLLVDSYDADAQVAAPSPGCTPVGGGHGGEFEGDRIVAVCDGTEWLLDPYAGAEPIER